MAVEMSAPLTSKQAAWQKWYAKVKADPQWQERRKAQKAESRAKPSCKRQKAVTDWLWATCNRDKTRVNSRRYYAKNVDVQRSRCRDNRQRWRAEHGLPLHVREIEYIDYAKILEESKGMCGICHLPIGESKMHFDHIIPLSKGGPHVQSNLQVAHALCNIVKGNRISVEGV